MRLTAIHTIGLGGVYHAPGSTIEVEPAEGARLIELGAAREVAEPATEPEAETEADTAPRRRRGGRSAQEPAATS